MEVDKSLISRITKKLIDNNILNCHDNGASPKFYFDASNDPYHNLYHWTNKQKEILFGELLGDGCITHSQSNNNHHVFSHATISKEHEDYLKRKLPDGLFNKNMPYKCTPQVNKESNNRKTSWRVMSKSIPFLSELYHKWYPFGFKIVPDDLILTPTICFHWYVGDGHLELRPHKYSKAIELYTMSFNKNDVLFLVSQLKNEGFNVKEYVIKNKRYNKKYLAIRIKQSSVDNFLEWIGEPVINFYEYKWGHTSQQVGQLLGVGVHKQN